eukprot:scaffold26621_cov74-Attheya_sp.AAC.1
MNAEPTNPEVNKEPPDDHGVTDGLQVGETESPQAATMGSTSTSSGTRAILFAVGENAVRTKEILITQVCLEFNLKHDEQRFNPRPKHVKLLQIMKSIDPMYQKHFTVIRARYNPEMRCPARFSALHVEVSALESSIYANI